MGPNQVSQYRKPLSTALGKAFTARFRHCGQSREETQGVLEFAIRE
jgi:hypothetical protein